MSDAINKHLRRAHLYRSFLAIGLSESTAKAATMKAVGLSSVAAFDESLRRADELIATLPTVARMERDLVTLGLEESAAREQALDHGWQEVNAAFKARTSGND